MLAIPQNLVWSPREWAAIASFLPSFGFFMFCEGTARDSISQGMLGTAS